MSRRSRMAVCLLLLGILCTCVAAHAELAHFDTIPVADEKVQTYIRSIDLVRLSEEPPLSGIACFDVRDDGMIAIGLDSGDRKTIGVYGPNGVFHDGYTFNCSGSYGIEWDQEQLLVYFVRGDIAMTIDLSGTVADIRSIPNTTENNHYWNHSVKLRKRVVGSSVYWLDNNPGILNALSGTYSQLKFRDDSGAEHIIYDASSVQTPQMILTIALCLLIAIFALTIVVKQFLKLRIRQE